jgi:serine protease Do
MTRRAALFVALGFALAFWTGAQLNGLDLPSFFPFGKSAQTKKIDPQPVAPSVENLQDSFAAVAARVKPAVVNITTEHVETYAVQPYQFYFGDPFEEFFHEFFGQPSPRRRAPPRKLERRHQGMGSGVIVDPRGYILTNAHVVQGADKIQVRLPQKTDKVYSGKVVGTDVRSDLAVVKIAHDDKLPFLTVGDSDKVRVGDWSIAVGSPFGLEQTVTVGVISAVRQSLTIEGKNFHNMLQTDAAINQGNSGGPLVNVAGELIGVNTAIYAPTGVFAGVGFAIPSNFAKEIMDQLIETGRVVRGWLGVEIAPMDDVLARQFGLPDVEGVLINRVLPGSPADKAGLKRGDVIREFDGERMQTPEALQRRVAKTAPEKTVEVVVFREGKEQKFSLVTGKMPESAEEAARTAGESDETTGGAFEWEGARFVPADEALAERYGFPAGAGGVVAAHVAPDGAAAEAGLAPGDLVASVNRVPTPDLKSFRKAVKDADLRKGVVFDINRRGRWLYLTYRAPG